MRFILAVLILVPALVHSSDWKEEARKLGAPIPSEEEQCFDRIDKVVPAKYPKSAIAERTEGWAVISFTLSAEGAVIDPKVQSESPPGIFYPAALESLQSSTFAASIAPRSCRMLFTFTLS